MAGSDKKRKAILHGLRLGPRTPAVVPVMAPHSVMMAPTLLARQRASLFARSTRK
jgi:hypothetical protein